MGSKSTAGFVVSALAVGMLVTGSFIHFDLAEQWFEITRAYEDWEFDELAGAVIGLLAAGCVLGFQIVFKLKEEIRGRAGAERQLRESEARFRNFAETAADWFWETDADFKYTRVSPDIARFTGFGPDYFYGRSRLDTPGLNEDEEHLEIHRSDLQERRPFHGFEYSFRTASGEMLSVSASGIPVFDEEGEFVGYLGTTRDISNRKEAELALQRSEERFRDIAETASDWFWEMDSDFRFTYFSERYADFQNVPLDKIIGKTRQEIAEADADDQLWVKHQRDLDEGVPFRDFVYEVRLPEGKTGERSVSGNPIFDIDGRFAGYRGTATDITSQKEVERLKREFVSIVSHELRTPLTSIKGSLGLVMGGQTGHLSEQTLQMINIAHRNCDRLVRLINDILDIDKLEDGKIEFEMERIDIVHLVEDAVEANRSFGKEFDVTIRVTHPPPRISVWGDADRLAQVLTNLLSNAVKFSSPDDTVDVSVVPNEELVRVSIVDHGSGIAPEFRHRIFERFAQADSSDNRKIYGSGLGLTISRAIVERQDGTIDFDSEVGSGTCFYFDLPILEKDQANSLANLSIG